MNYRCTTYPAPKPTREVSKHTRCSLLVPSLRCDLDITLIAKTRTSKEWTGERGGKQGERALLQPWVRDMGFFSQGANKVSTSVQPSGKQEPRLRVPTILQIFRHYPRAGITKVADSHNWPTLKGVTIVWHSKSKKEIFFGETLEHYIERLQHRNRKLCSLRFVKILNRIIFAKFQSISIKSGWVISRWIFDLIFSHKFSIQRLALCCIISPEPPKH